MRWGIPLCLFLALTAIVDARAVEQDSADKFAAGVDECQRNNIHVANARALCLRSIAITRIYSDLKTAARERLFAGFDDDYPDLGDDAKNGLLIAAAKHWKDLPRPGPEGREYLLLLIAPPPGQAPATVARLRRARGQSIDIQAAHFLQGRIDFERDLGPLSSLEPRAIYIALQKKAPVEAFLATLSLEDMTADEASCPAVRDTVTNLARINLPLPAQLKTPQQPRAIRSAVLHPHVVMLRVPDHPISLTLRDASMDTDVFRWVDASARALEPCWRALSERPQPPAQR